MSLYLRVFWECFNTGLFAIGGGMATLPFLKDIGQSTGWYTQSDLMNMLAVSESTPGPIGINMATYVGFTAGSAYGTLGGILGAIVATVGEVTPSIIVILIIAGMLQKFRSSRYVEGAFYGLRPASAALIAAAGVSVLTVDILNLDLFASTGILTDLIRWKSLLLAAAVLVLTNFVKPTKKLHPIVFILASAVVGAVFGFAGV